MSTNLDNIKSDEGRRASIRPQKPCAVFKACKKEILAKIALHYPEAEREAVWEQVQLRYAELLSDWRTDLGGKKNRKGHAPYHDAVSVFCHQESILVEGRYAEKDTVV